MMWSRNVNKSRRTGMLFAVLYLPALNASDTRSAASPPSFEFSSHVRFANWYFVCCDCIFTAAAYPCCAYTRPERRAQLLHVHQAPRQRKDAGIYEGSCIDSRLV